MLTLCAKPDGYECLLPQLSSVNDRCSTSLPSWLEVQGKRCISIPPCLASETLELAIVFM